MAGQTRIDGNLIDTGTDPNDIVSVSVGDGRYPRLSEDNTLAGNLTVDGELKLGASGSGTGIFTVAASDSNTDRTLTLPDEEGTVATIENLPSSGLVSSQTFESSGTYTKPSNVKQIRVYVTGGGGGGGRGGSTNRSGAGGGGGGTAVKIIDATSITTVSVTVGSGGPGGDGPGDTGGTSSFGSFCSATGGTGGHRGGSIGNPNPDGGIGSNGDLNLKGNAGVTGNDNNNDPNAAGSGGASFWGGGGSGKYNGPGLGGDNGGGGGAGNRTGNNGGDGGDGIVYIEEYE